MRSRQLSSLPALTVVVFLVAACGGGSSTTGSSTTAAGPDPAASQPPRGGPPQQSKPPPGHPRIGTKPGHGSNDARRSGRGSSERSQRRQRQPGPGPGTVSTAPRAAGKHHEGLTRASNRAAERRAKRHPQAAVRKLRQAAGKAAPFLVPVGDNSIPTYGTEASGSQLAAAEAALSGYLTARAEGNWAAACSVMASSIVKQLEELAGEAGAAKQNCAAAYAKLSESIPAAERADPLTQGLTALRIESPHAFALFYGPGEQQYIMPLEEEGGGWKVSQIEPVPWPVGSTAK